jgi:hypothetical protein
MEFGDVLSDLIECDSRQASSDTHQSHTFFSLFFIRFDFGLKREREREKSARVNKEQVSVDQANSRTIEQTMATEKSEKESNLTKR